MANFEGVDALRDAVRLNGFARRIGAAEGAERCVAPDDAHPGWWAEKRTDNPSEMTRQGGRLRALPRRARFGSMPGSGDTRSAGKKKPRGSPGLCVAVVARMATTSIRRRGRCGRGHSV